LEHYDILTSVWQFQFSKTRFGFGFLKPKNRRTVQFRVSLIK